MVNKRLLLKLPQYGKSLLKNKYQIIPYLAA